MIIFTDGNTNPKSESYDIVVPKLEVRSLLFLTYLSQLSIYCSLYTFINYND